MWVWVCGICMWVCRAHTLYSLLNVVCAVVLADGVVARCTVHPALVVQVVLAAGCALTRALGTIRHLTCGGQRFGANSVMSHSY